MKLKYKSVKNKVHNKILNKVFYSLECISGKDFIALSLQYKRVSFSIQDKIYFSVDDNVTVPVLDYLWLKKRLK